MKSKLIGIEVKNIKKEPGIVKDLDDKYIYVDFAGTVKQFVYPDAFDKFLVIDDVDLMDEIKEASQIKKTEKEKKAKEEKIKKEQERELKGVITRGSIFLTHNEVLNECFDCNNKGIFRRAFKKLDGWDNCAVWFPKIAHMLQGEYISSDSYNHFINILADSGKIIIEKNEDMEEMEKHKDLTKGITRFVFGQYDGESCYRFLGVFSEEECVDVTVNGKKYVRIAEKIDLDQKTYM